MTVFNFVVYNGEQVYDVDSQTTIGQWVGDTTCKAELSYSEMNFDTYQQAEVVKPLTLGGINAVELSGADITLKLTANEGFKFSSFENEEDKGSVTENTEASVILLMPWSEFSGHYSKTFQYKISLVSTGGVGGGGDPDPDPDPEPELTPISATIENNYLLTPEQFKLFRKELYAIVEGESISSEFQKATAFKSNDFISGLRLYPFLIPSSEQTELKTIKIKDRTMTSQSMVLKDNIINLSLGLIEISKPFNNALDYLNVRGELFIPFYTGSIDLDLNLLMGETLKIDLEIVINTGDATINIIKVSDNTVVQILKSTVGGEFPLFNAVNQDQVVFTPQQALNSIRQAYILLSVPNYAQSKPTAERKGVLTSVTGDVKVSEIDLVSDAYADEKMTIESLLSQGIIIK